MLPSAFAKFLGCNSYSQPRILTRNTSQAVSTCASQICKHIPNNRKCELSQIKASTRQKVENKAPIRFLLGLERIITKLESQYPPQKPIEKPTRKPKTQPSAVTVGRLLNGLSNKKNISTINFAAKTKLEKSGKYKIHGSSRRFSTSSSSSCSSFFQRGDERRNKRNKKTSQQPSTRRSVSSQRENPLFSFTPSMMKVLMPIRNQSMQNKSDSVPRTIELSNGVRCNLMSIDKAIKQLISVTKSHLIKLSPEPGPKNQKQGSFSGWNHPPAHDVFCACHQHQHQHQRETESVDFKGQYHKLKVAHRHVQTDDLGKYVLEKKKTLDAISVSNRHSGLNRTLDSLSEDPPRRHQHACRSDQKRIPTKSDKTAKQCESGKYCRKSSEKPENPQKPEKREKREKPEKPDKPAPKVKPPTASPTNANVNSGTSALRSVASALEPHNSRHNRSHFRSKKQ